MISCRYSDVSLVQSIVLEQVGQGVTIGIVCLQDSTFNKHRQRYYVGIVQRVNVCTTRKSILLYLYV
jgi:predicted transcriptional regulator